MLSSFMRTGDEYGRSAIARYPTHRPSIPEPLSPSKSNLTSPSPCPATPLQMARFLHAQHVLSTPHPHTLLSSRIVIATRLDYEAAESVITFLCTKLIVAVRSLVKSEAAKPAIA
jgi:hypothetical protein